MGQEAVVPYLKFAAPLLVWIVLGRFLSMRILFVAMVNSIHTARWINQIADQGWDIHLFPSQDSDINPELRNITIHDRLVRSVNTGKNVKQGKSLPWPLPGSANLANRAISRLRRVEFARWTKARNQRLARLIDKIEPDIIHSLEMQHAGYLTFEAMKICQSKFPPWMLSIWGSDLYLFSRLAGHVSKIRAALSACNYFGAECQRDLDLAKTLGFQKETLPRLPMFGGFDLDTLRRLWQPGPISARRLIVLKGYQDWAGRSLVGLRALELCADVLKEYRIAIPVASEDVKLAAELMSSRTGIPVDIIPPYSNLEILKLHGRARTSIGLSISDGLPASFAEALVMGSFPIQSCTSCADEWIEDGKTGLIVPPEDPEPIAAAIRRAVSDDYLVDRAAELNAYTVRERLDCRSIQPQVIAMYRKVAAKSGHIR